jgi:putative tricarboxylic transport membrane protein
MYAQQLRRLSAVAMSAMSMMVATVLTVAPVSAQQWRPDKPVEIVVGVGPGGPQDRTARLIQKAMQELKLSPVPVNVLNRPGGGGAVALAYVAQYTGEGQYLTLNSPSLLSNHILGRSATAPSDFTPVAVLGAEYVSVTVRADSPIRSARDLQDRLRKDPGSLSVVIGTTIGTATHLSFVVAMKAAGVDIRRIKGVVFNSGAESMSALLGGHIDVVAGAPSNVIPHIRAGKLRMLAIGAPQRMTGDLADVPTWRELGVPNTFDVWRGLTGPRGMTAAQVRYWDDALAKVAQSDEWRRGTEAVQAANIYMNSTDTAKYWKTEYDEMKTLLTELGFAK